MSRPRVLVVGPGDLSAGGVRGVMVLLAGSSLSDRLDLIDRTKVSRLMAGYRDFPPVDRAALAALLIRVAQMIADHDAGAALYASQGNLATDVTLRSTAGGDAVDLRNRRDQAIRLQSDID